MLLNFISLLLLTQLVSGSLRNILETVSDAFCLHT